MTKETDEMRVILRAAGVQESNLDSAVWQAAKLSAVVDGNKNPRCSNSRQAKRRAKKLQRLRDERNDYWEWLWFARSYLRPSQRRKAQAHLDKLDARLATLRGGA